MRVVALLCFSRSIMISLTVSVVAFGTVNAGAIVSIAEQKKLLTEIGCFDGPLDERETLKFRTAVRCAQKAMYQAGTGELSPKQVERLRGMVESGEFEQRQPTARQPQSPPDCSMLESSNAQYRCRQREMIRSSGKGTEFGYLYRGLQADLKWIGCLSGKVRETRTPEYVEAVKCFQERIAVAQTGSLSRSQADTLGEMASDAMDKWLNAREERYRTNMLKTVSSRQGRFLTVDGPNGECSGRFAIDLDHSKAGVAHVLLSGSSEFGAPSTCETLQHLLDVFAAETVDGMHTLIEYSVDTDGKSIVEGLDGGKLRSVRLYSTRAVRHKRSIHGMITMINTSEWRPIRSLLYSTLTDDPETQFLELGDFGKALLDLSTMSPLFREEIEGWNRLAVAAQEQAQAKRQRDQLERDARREAARRAPPCGQAVSRLAYCEVRRNYLGAVQTLCDGQPVTGFRSQATRCPVGVDGIWCDTKTGALYNDRLDGVVAICAP